jgi:hypothetical protein
MPLQTGIHQLSQRCKVNYYGAVSKILYVNRLEHKASVGCDQDDENDTFDIGVCHYIFIILLFKAI